MLCTICLLLTGYYYPANDGSTSSNKKWPHLPEVCGLNRFDNRRQETRILKGDVARLGQFPWMARLGVRLTDTQSFFYCGGSLITRYFVISAAHCEEHGDVVRLGENNEATEKDCDDFGDCAPPYQDIDIEKYYFNKFCQVTFENDIILIQLKTEALFNEYVWPICLPTSELKQDELLDKPIWLSGWGKINSELNSESDQLLYVTTDIVNNSYCDEYFDPTLKSGQLCIGDHTGKGACEGDSGGPAAVYLPVDHQLRAHLIGLASAAKEHCAVGYTVYTNVSYHIDWIIYITNKKT